MLWNGSFTELKVMACRDMPQNCKAAQAGVPFFQTMMCQALPKSVSCTVMLICVFQW